MIIIKMIYWLYNLLKGSNIDVLVSSDFWDLINSISGFVGLFVPLGTVKAILSITLLLMTFRLLIAVFKTLWSILPLV